MPSISMLIKPASSLCNLSCKYCFYKEEADSRAESSYGIMTKKTAEKVIERAFEAATDRVSFAFQGGEPTLTGVEFYRDFIQKVNECNKNKLPVAYSIQTNGILLADDREFAEFLARNRFLVGLSVDGDAVLHDKNRVYSDGSGSFETVMRAAEQLRRAKCDFNILTVVNKDNVRYAERIYKAFRSRGFEFMQFIPCLGADSPEDREYGEFLCRLFELWYTDAARGRYISVRLFDDLLRMLSGRLPDTCGMLGICSVQFVIEANGNVYPCDFYCTDGYLLGNLHESGLRELFESDTAQSFIKSSCKRIDECRSCRWYKLCNGGCRRYRNVVGKYCYCEAMKRFYEYAVPRLARIRVQSER